MRRTIAIILMLAFFSACGVDPIERNNAGNYHTLSSNPHEAIRAYESALLANPENALFYFNASLAYEQVGDNIRAIESLKQAIQRGDVTLKSQAYYNLGNLYLRLSRPDEAIVAYQNALLLNDKNDDARINLEIALNARFFPTPTPLEQQTRPEIAQVDSSATPTPNPGSSIPTPTPTPLPDSPAGDPPENIGFEGDDEDLYRTTPQFSISGTLTVQEALEILEQQEPQRDNLPGGLPQLTPFAVTPMVGKDW